MNDLIRTRKEVMERHSNQAVDYAEAFEILDDDDYKIADLKIIEWKTLMKDIAVHHDPIIKAAHIVHKVSIAAKNKFYGPPDAAQEIVKRKMALYRYKRAEDQARKQRIIDEKEKDEHRAACEKEAQEMEAKGADTTAFMIREMKEDAPMVAPRQEPELRSSTKFRKSWEITSINRDDIPAQYLVVDEKKILQAIRLNKGKIQIPGVNFVEVEK